MRRLALLLPVLLLCLAAPALAGGPGHDRGVAHRLDATLTKVRAQVGKPGVEATLVRNGRVVWSAERGTAVLQPKRPVRRATLFALGSFGKLMLASFALDRAEAGALDLQAPISKYVGTSIPGATVVTTRELLAHTAGYPDVYSSPEVGPLFGDQYDPNRSWSFATLLPGIDEPVDPGARWEYSNTGYIVLARVLEAVTEEPLARAFARYARPAGVTKRDLTLRRSSSALRRFAHGYVDNGSSLSDSFAGAAGIPTDLYGLPFGDGGFAGTARAAARFLDGLLVRGRLLRSVTVRRMIEPTPESLAAPAMGEIQGYGMGTATYRAAGHPWRGHDGTYVGFTTMAATDMRRGVSIAVVTNRQLKTQQPAIVLWRALAEAYADATRAHR